MVKDFNGNELSIGDTVAYGVRNGYRAGDLRSATIEDIKDVRVRLVGKKDNGQRYELYRYSEFLVKL